MNHGKPIANEYLAHLLRRIVHIIFFGNIFYGIAAVLLALETVAKLPLPALDWRFYLLLGLGSIYFYTESYRFDPAPQSGNLRAKWIYQNRRWLKLGQWCMLAICLVLTTTILYQFGAGLRVFAIREWLLAAIFPIAAVLYYGLTFPGRVKVNIRQSGFTKPLVIGWVWTGTVVVYPILMAAMQYGQAPQYAWPMLWYFVHNLMFITVLCILFDIKDYAADHNAELKTYVVRNGLRSTIFRFVIPLVLLGMASYLAFWLPRQIPAGRLLINFVPFLLLIAVAYSMHRRRSILYYLLVIDGLMVVKALLGLVGTAVFAN